MRYQTDRMLPLKVIVCVVLSLTRSFDYIVVSGCKDTMEIGRKVQFFSINRQLAEAHREPTMGELNIFSIFSHFSWVTFFLAHTNDN